MYVCQLINEDFDSNVYLTWTVFTSFGSYIIMFWNASFQQAVACSKIYSYLRKQMLTVVFYIGTIPLTQGTELTYTVYSVSSIHCSRMHCFHASVIHLLWSLYIAHINNFPAFILYVMLSLQKMWIDVSLYYIYSLYYELLCPTVSMQHSYMRCFRH
jgi:hypothetical protein